MAYMINQCARCRLRSLIASGRLIRGGPNRLRYLSNTGRSHLSNQIRQSSALPPRRREEEAAVSVHDFPPLSRNQDDAVNQGNTPEDAAREARHIFGDVLPPGYLTTEEYKCYERLYGEPIPIDTTLDLDSRDPRIPNVELLRESDDGSLTDVPYELDHVEQPFITDSLPIESDISYKRLVKSKKGKFFARAAKAELDEAVLRPAMSKSDEALLPDLTSEWQAMHDFGRRMYLEDISYFKLEHHLRRSDRTVEADELVQFLFLRYQSMRKMIPAADHVPSEDVRADETDVEDDSDPALRTHPFTQINRFSTFPSTVYLPKSTFTDPVSATFANIPFPSLRNAAHQIFGGQHVPYSPSMPNSHRGKEQKPIPLSALQSDMSAMQADAYMAAVYPGVFASVTSTLVETRKRLGQYWLRDLMTKPGGPLILDAGGAGAGVLATREVLRAEWESMHDTTGRADAQVEIALAGGETGGAPAEVPYGKSTVVVGSDNLRHRISPLLENTAFVPRLPDYVHASDETAQQRGKFDIVIAPHTLWAIDEEYARKQHMSKLWSLVSSDGGVLILLEKGVPKAFEAVAGARQFLLDKRILGPEEQIHDQPAVPAAAGQPGKEPGMIIAPCTNHSLCPMQRRDGGKKSKRTICHFQQRYIRPPFLQRLIGARDKNFEDVKFSYLSVMRGRDLRHENLELIQGEQATARAFAGYEHADPKSNSPTDDLGATFDPTAPALSDTDTSLISSSTPLSLNLPRVVMPPLKRTGHVILDLCTPGGRLERWTVPKSFSRQAYRDARKSSWGDLWALGAKTRVNKDSSSVREAQAGGLRSTSRSASSARAPERGNSKKIKADRSRRVGRGTAEIQETRASGDEDGLDPVD